jgi:hypothetical protein
MSELSLNLWRSAPLEARLRFVSELLPAEDSLQGALKEAIGVVQLWRRGAEMESWAQAYPSLVVDTYARLEAVTTLDDEAQQVAGELLRETLGLLDAALRAFGFEWVRPALGESPPSDCRCEGEGKLVAACLRPGLKHRGVVLLPAEVQLGDAAALAAEPNLQAPQIQPVGAVRPVGPIGSTSEVPDWLRTLQQRGSSLHLPALEALVSAGASADDALLFRAADGLREVLSCEDGGSSLRTWLKDALKLEVLQPSQGTSFDPQKMQAVSERRTVHEHEADTVARLERPGFAKEGRVIVPAEVVRYVAGDAW